MANISISGFSIEEGVNISGFSIEEGVNMTFDTGGAVPPPAPETDNLGKPVNCMVMCTSAGTGFIGNLVIIPDENT